MYKEKDNGFEFLDFLSLNESNLISFHPIAGSYAVLRCEGKILLCYNKWRQQWEIPAGKREEYETSKECALRELFEETGQSLSEIKFKGLVKVKNKRRGTIKYNPLYITTIDYLKPFVENEETSEVRLWDSKENIGVIDSVDVKIVSYLNNQGT